MVHLKSDGTPLRDFIHIDPNEPPWCPAQYETEKIAEYDTYDMPLVGVVRQRGDLYLFHCIFGQLEPLNLWVYTPIAQAELEDLEGVAFDGFIALVNELSQRAGVLAIALEDIGVIASKEVNDWSTLDRVAGELLTAFQAWIERYQAVADTTRRRLDAGLSAAGA